jgi:hypothetical protein
MSDQHPVCGVCGRPATHWARDIIRTPNYETGIVELAPIGAATHGCDEHPAESHEYHSSGLPIYAPADTD